MACCEQAVTGPQEHLLPFLNKAVQLMSAQTSLLRVSRRVFPEEINISVGGFNSVKCLVLPSVGGQPVEGLRTKNGRGRRNLPLSLPSYLLNWNIDLLPSDWDLYHQLPWFSGLHTQTRIKPLAF